MIPVPRQWQVLARDPETNNVAQIFRLKPKKKRAFRKAARVKARRKLSKRESKRAAKWAEEKGLVPFRTKSKYPFVVLDSDTRMPRKELAQRMNELGRLCRRYLWCGEGWRTNARQWELWREYLRGGNLAAYPGTSRHESGLACDISILHSGRGGDRTTVGSWPGARTWMRRLGLALCVPGEDWHAEISNDWRA